MNHGISKVGEKAPYIIEATATGSAAIDTTITPVSDFRIISVSVHFATDPGDAVTTALDALQGAAYDMTLNTATSQNYLYVPAIDFVCKKGNAIKVTGPNAGTIVYGLVVRYELV